MDEGFLKSGLEQMGEMNVLSIKVMKNKITGEPASYGFVKNHYHCLPAMQVQVRMENGSLKSFNFWCESLW